MNRSHRMLPVYTGDVSGACSALFELGGMVVIHDPSGCNSTYNTHDETRWYDHDSLIFITGLTERDAVLGNDAKLVDDTVAAALELRPRFIALCNSPIPFITGTDFAALAKLIERKCGIPCFYVPTNGMHDYSVGASAAFVALAERLALGDHEMASAGPARAGTRCKPTRGQMKSSRGHSLNLLGVTPLDFNGTDPGAALREFVAAAGFETTSCWAMGSSLDELAQAGGASVNLVVSATGLATAELLRERFGTPYVVGRPILAEERTAVGLGDAFGAAFNRELANALVKAEATGGCFWPCKDLRSEAGDEAAVAIGEPVARGSLAAALGLESGKPVRVVSPIETGRAALKPSDCATDGEEEAETTLASAPLVYGDAFYQLVLAPKTHLIPLPHLAFSGRQANGPATR